MEKELPDGIEFFKKRLHDAIYEGANFRDPIDWQRYGPLFFKLFEKARYHVSFYPCDESEVATIVRDIESEMHQNAQGYPPHKTLFIDDEPIFK